MSEVASTGDPQLNMLKNRIDEGNYVQVTFDAILNMTWPKMTERRDMSTWSAEDAAAIAKYEGIPVVVEGYLFGPSNRAPSLLTVMPQHPI